jgi:hypothetical protein
LVVFSSHALAADQIVSASAFTVPIGSGDLETGDGKYRVEAYATASKADQSISRDFDIIYINPSSNDVTLALKLLDSNASLSFKSFSVENFNPSGTIQEFQVRGLFQGTEVFPWHTTSPGSITFDGGNYNIPTKISIASIYQTLRVDEVQIQVVGLSGSDIMNLEFRQFTLAEVQEVVYNVNFDLGDGTRTGGGALMQQVAAGGAAVVPTVQPPSGYSLTGWSTTDYLNVQRDTARNHPRSVRPDARRSGNC